MFCQHSEPVISTLAMEVHGGGYNHHMYLIFASESTINELVDQSRQ